MAAPAPAEHPGDRPSNPDKPFYPCTIVGMETFDEAPVRFRFSVDLPISAEQLFEVFEDPDAWSRWATGIGGVEWTSPKPFGPGTTRTVTFWGGMEVYEDFFRFDAPNEMAFCFYGTTEYLWNSFAEHYRVEALGPDTCRFHWRVAYDPSGRLTLPGVTTIMKWNLGSYMGRLKRYVKKRFKA